MDVKVIFPGGKRVDALINGFTIKTDQTVQNGGEGAEPEPFTLFIASIAACSGIYVLAFCQNRGISTDGIYLTMTNEVDPVKRLISKVIINIIVPDAFPQKYYEPLIRSAEQCAVAKHIEETLPVFAVDVLAQCEVE